MIRSLGLPRAVSGQTVDALAYDSLGALWIGTPLGLLSYNGFDAPTLYNEADGMPRQPVTALYADRKGRVWVGLRSGTIYVREHRRFRKFAPPEGLPAKPITDFCEDARGNLWFATNGEGVYCFDGQRLHNYNLPSDAPLDAAPAGSDELLSLLEEGGTTVAPGLNVYCVQAAPNGEVWAGADDGLYCYTPRDSGKYAPRRYSMKEGLPDNLVQGIRFTGSGQGWLALRDSGLCRFDDKGRFQMVKGWRYGSLRTLAATPDGLLHVGTENRGLVTYDPASGRYRSIGADDGLGSAQVRALAADAQQTLWLGTGSGVAHLLGQRFAFLTRRQGLPSSNVFSVLRDRRGGYWVGTDSGLVHLTRSATGALQARQLLPVRAVGPKSATVVSLAEDPQGYIWAGTFRYLYRINPAGGAPQRIPQLDSLTQEGVLSMSVDRRGQLWLSAVGVGLVRVNYDAQGAIRATAFGARQGLPSSYLYQVVAAPNGHVWAATDGSGLARWDGQRFRMYAEAQGLPGRSALSVQLDPRGQPYVLTQDAGIVRLRGGRFERLPNTQFASGSLPTAIVFTSRGELVAAAPGQISRIDLRSLAHRDYGEEDGLTAFDPTQNAVYRDADGLVWIGTSQGLVMYDPASASPNDAPPMVRLVRQRLAGRDTVLADGAELAYDQNNLTFDWTALELTRPRKVRYQYKMVGYDADWSLPTTARFVTYQNLPPGEFTFQVRASVNENEWTQYPDQKVFVIRPPLYLEPWFLVAVSLLSVLGIALLVRQRIRAVEVQNRQLEAKVAERTAEVVAQKEEIERKSGQLQQAFEEIEAKNSDITESIQYARRIQTALLPDIERVRQHLPNSFVYFRAKDIVSGDFFWFDAREDGWLLLAACDCTGHGVPGAFMAVMGHNLLNQVSREMDLYRPDEVLAQLDALIRRALRQDDLRAEAMDGMDVALCAIHPQSRQVLFSGAMRPLYYVQDGALHEIKGDRFAIGGSGENKHFTCTELHVQDGERFYMFSDGVVDQFGAQTGRKYTPKRLKSQLMAVQALPLAAQPDVLGPELERWQGALEQLDDQLLVGFSL